MSRKYQFRNAVSVFAILALIVSSIYTPILMKKSEILAGSYDLLALNNIVPDYWGEESNVEENTSASSSSSSSSLYHHYHPKTAREIVNKAYNESYAMLASFCSKTNIGTGEADYKYCLRRLKESGSNHTGGSPPWPWWFHTMLRDMGGFEKGSVPEHYKRRTAPIHGPWHVLDMIPPANIKFCAIEKVATTQFRRVQCELNTGTSKERSPSPCHPKTKLTVEESSRVVFLRDPLERFLSGFINKCINRIYARTEGHCEPNVIFRDNGMPKIDKNKNETSKIKSDNVDYLDVLLREKHVFFEAFVDSSPLQWNAHFFPQSLYCDGLYRHIQDYDFVGTMDENFHQNVYQFGQKYGHELPSVLEKIFNLKKFLDVNQTKQLRSNQGVETSASTKVYEYYNPYTVRKVLQYMAIDYVLLDLPIPSWVDEILSQQQE